MNEEFLKKLGDCWRYIEPKRNKCSLKIKDIGTFDGEEYEIQTIFKMKKKRQYDFVFKILDKFPLFIKTHVFKLHNNEVYWKYLLKNPEYRHSIINNVKEALKKD
jgi:hypothetical protein